MNNEQYKSLAHEKAILLHILRLAQDKYLPVEGMVDPEVRIESDDLPRHECSVPEDAIIEVLLRIRKLAENVEKEMTNFKFVKTEGEYDKAWKSERESQQGPTQPPAKGKQGKVKGGKGSPQTPAAK